LRGIPTAPDALPHRPTIVPHLREAFSSSFPYPTDVIGGWIIGFAWASICWLVEERFESRTGIAEEKARSG
jgi:hypothetical protein